MYRYTVFIALLIGGQAQNLASVTSDVASGVVDIIDNVKDGFSEKDIIRPCPKLNQECIGVHLAQHSSCKPVYGPVPEPYPRAQANLFFPTFGISSTLTGVQYTGIGSGVAKEFYVNPKTDLTVLTVKLTNVTVTSSRDLIRYHRTGREPAITKSTTSVKYPSFSITTVFRGNNRLNLLDSQSTAFVDALPKIKIGPRGGEHSDPEVPKRFARLLSRPGVMVQEGFLTDAPFFAASFIQHALCDFGVRPL